MRISHVITKFDVGGAQSVVRELSVLHAAAGHQVTVYTGSVGAASRTAEAAGVRVRELASLRHPLAPRDDLQTLRELRNAFAAEPPDVLHAHSSKGGLLGRIAARRSGIPSVYTAHGWPFQRGAGVVQRAQSFIGESIASRLGDIVVCVGEFEAQLARRLRVVSRAKLRVITNGTSRFESVSAADLPRRRQVADPFVAVMVARFSPPKRQDLLIDALVQLPDWFRVVFVGDGEERVALEERTSSLGDRVVFCPPEAVAAELSRANAFVLLSDYEGVPMSVIEAMSCSLPIVANDLPGIQELVDEGVHGLIVEKSATSVASALRMLANDPHSAEDIGRSAQNRWNHLFTAERMAADYYALYLEISARGR